MSHSIQESTLPHNCLFLVFQKVTSPVIDRVREKMPNVDAESFSGVTNVQKKTLEQGEISL